MSGLEAGWREGEQSGERSACELDCLALIETIRSNSPCHHRREQRESEWSEEVRRKREGEVSNLVLDRRSPTGLPLAHLAHVDVGCGESS